MEGPRGATRIARGSSRCWARERDKHETRARERRGACVCVRNVRVLRGETGTRAGRVVLPASEGEIEVRGGRQTTRARQKTTRAARVWIGPCRFYVL